MKHLGKVPVFLLQGL